MFCGRGILTAQESEIFINDSGLELRWLKPYFVRRDDNSSAYPVSPDVPGGTGRCSSNWNGYIATMRLHADHRLELVQFDFPYHENTPTQICNAFFTGDFSITFRPFFHGPNTTIPFRDGRVIPDQDEWGIDDQLLDGVVSRVLRKPNTNEPYGLIVDIWFPAFAPRSLLPEIVRGDLDTLVGKSVKCSLFDIDEKRRSVIVKLERVVEP